MPPADQLWSSDERVVRVLPRRAGTTYALTGYTVGDELVLTCAHDVHDADSVAVRCSGDGEPVDATVLWPAEEDGDLDLDVIDVALLRVPGLQAPAGRLVWGEHAEGSPPKPARCTGFPRADKRGRTRHAARVRGTYTPGEGSAEHRLRLAVDTSDPVDDHGRKGLSGAALIDDHGVLGIVTDRSETYSGRIHALPAATILAQARLRALLGGPGLVRFADRHPLLREPFEPLPDETDFKLITARYGQVEFVKESHGDALDALIGWCRGDDRADISVRLLTGPAGAGKTRLAAELCKRIAEEDPSWAAGFALDDPDAPWTDHTPDSPLLLVFDYIERQSVTKRATDLLNRLAAATLRFPVRVLLVSRTAGSWYAELNDRAGATLRTHLEAEENRIFLSRTDFGPDERRLHFHAAYRRFTAGLAGARDPESFDDAIDDGQYDSPLLVHIAALLAARGEHLPAPEVDGLRDRLLDFLLRRERRHRWTTARALSTTFAGPDESEQARHAVAIMTLTSPAVTEATDLLRASPQWDDQPYAARWEAAGALARLYPADAAARRAAPIEPDLVSEHLVAGIEGLDAVLGNLLTRESFTADHFARLLHLLALTCDHYPRIIDHVHVILGHAFALAARGDLPGPAAEAMDQRLPKLTVLAVRHVIENGSEDDAERLAEIVTGARPFPAIVEAVAGLDLSALRRERRLARLGHALYGLTIELTRVRSSPIELIHATEGLAFTSIATGHSGNLLMDRLIRAAELRRGEQYFEDSAWLLDSIAELRSMRLEESDFDSARRTTEASIDLRLAASARYDSGFAADLAALERIAELQRDADEVSESLDVLRRSMRIRIGLGLTDRGDYEELSAGLFALANPFFEGTPVGLAGEAAMELIRLRWSLADLGSGFTVFESSYFGNLVAMASPVGAVRTESDLVRVRELRDSYKRHVEAWPESGSDAADWYRNQALRCWHEGLLDLAAELLGDTVEACRLESVTKPIEYALALWESGIAEWNLGDRESAIERFGVGAATASSSPQRTEGRWPVLIRLTEERAAAYWAIGRRSDALEHLKVADGYRSTLHALESDDDDDLSEPDLLGSGLDLPREFRPLMAPHLKVDMLELLLEENQEDLPLLASAYEEASGLDTALTQHDVQSGEALSMMEKAVGIWRRLTEVSIAAHGERFRTALVRLARLHLEKGRHAEANQAVDEAHDILRHQIEAGVVNGHDSAEVHSELEALRRI